MVSFPFFFFFSPLLLIFSFLLACQLTHTHPLLTPAEILLKARALKAVDRPSNRDYQSVMSFMEADEGQLYEAEMDFIYEKEDLVTLRPGRDHGWLDVLVERFLLYFRCRFLIVRLFLPFQ